MQEVELHINEKGRGGFYISEDGEQLGVMQIGITGKDLIAFHTEVSPDKKGKGIGKILLETMVDYARGHGLKVIPLCPYVYAQFKRNNEKYADIWKKE